VIEGVVQRVDDRHRDVGRQVFGAPVLLGGRDDRVVVGGDPRVAVHRHPGRGQLLEDQRQERVGNRGVHQQ
jgi:hypothetical protein